MRLTWQHIFAIAATSGAAFTAMPAAATAPRIDADACRDLRLEQMKFVEIGILADLARGPDWAKANLSPEKLREIELFMQLDEQVKFGCRDAKISLDAERAGQAAIEIETPPAPPVEAKTPGEKKPDGPAPGVTVERIPAPAAKKPKAPSPKPQAAIEGVAAEKAAPEQAKRQKPKTTAPAANGGDFLFP